MARDDVRYPHGTPPPAATCRTLEETKWLRNHYLHRSARAVTEMPAYLGMESAANDTRVIIRDDKIVGKLSTPAKEYTLKKADAVGQGLNAAKRKMKDLWNAW